MSVSAPCSSTSVTPIWSAEGGRSSPDGLVDECVRPNATRPHGWVGPSANGYLVGYGGYLVQWANVRACFEQTLRWTRRLGSQQVHDMHGTYEAQSQEFYEDDEA